MQKRYKTDKPSAWHRSGMLTCPRCHFSETTRSCIHDLEFLNCSQNREAPVPLLPSGPGANPSRQQQASSRARPRRRRHRRGPRRWQGLPPNGAGELKAAVPGGRRSEGAELAPATLGRRCKSMRRGGSPGAWRRGWDAWRFSRWCS